VRVEMFNAGWLTVSLGLLRNGEPMEEMVRVPVPAFLIETGSERILVDTGLHPDAIADPDAFYGREHAYGPFRGEQEQSVAERVDLSTVTKVILTHLHFDHAGALPLVPAGVPAVVQRIEWEAGQDDAAAQKNFFLPPDYAGDRPIELVDGDHDLLGDGSVQLLFTPGHTPGHQSVRLGDLILAGDVVHFSPALDDLRLPLFGDDLEAQARSAERLRQLRDGGATVIPSHEPTLHHPGVLTT
jgi:N-acyl homoserine lactone hydrolase